MLLPAEPTASDGKWQPTLIYDETAGLLRNCVRRSCLFVPVAAVAPAEPLCRSLPTGRRAVRTYYSELRGDLTSSSFCGDESSLCKGSVRYPNAAAPLGHGVLLACLLPAQLLAHALYCS